jgi:hypothetical protein
MLQHNPAASQHSTQQQFFQRQGSKNHKLFQDAHTLIGLHFFCNQKLYLASPPLAHFELMAAPQHKRESKDKNIHQDPQDVHSSGDDNENPQVLQSMTAAAVACHSPEITRT